MPDLIQDPAKKRLADLGEALKHHHRNESHDDLQERIERYIDLLDEYEAEADSFRYSSSVLTNHSVSVIKEGKFSEETLNFIIGYLNTEDFSETYDTYKKAEASGYDGDSDHEVATDSDLSDENESNSQTTTPDQSGRVKKDPGQLTVPRLNLANVTAPMTPKDPRTPRTPLIKFPTPRRTRLDVFIAALKKTRSSEGDSHFNQKLSFYRRMFEESKSDGDTIVYEAFFNNTIQLTLPQKGDFSLDAINTALAFLDKDEIFCKAFKDHEITNKQLDECNKKQRLIALHDRLMSPPKGIKKPKRFKQKVNYYVFDFLDYDRCDIADSTLTFYSKLTEHQLVMNQVGDISDEIVEEIILNVFTNNDFQDLYLARHTKNKTLFYIGFLICVVSLVVMMLLLTLGELEIALIVGAGVFISLLLVMVDALIEYLQALYSSNRYDATYASFKQEVEALNQEEEDLDNKVLKEKGCFFSNVSSNRESISRQIKFDEISEECIEGVAFQQ